MYTGQGPRQGPETMGFYITLHTIRGQRPIVFYCVRLGPCPCPVYCVYEPLLIVDMKKINASVVIC